MGHRNSSKFLIAVFCLMVFAIADEVSAVVYEINPDKTLSINGVKTFPVFLYSAYDGYDKNGESDMSKVLTDFDGEVYGATFGSIFGKGSPNSNMKSQYENLGKGFTLWYASAGDPNTWGQYINSPSFSAFRIQQS